MATNKLLFYSKLLLLKRRPITKLSYFDMLYDFKSDCTDDLWYGTFKYKICIEFFFKVKKVDPKKCVQEIPNVLCQLTWKKRIAHNSSQRKYQGLVLSNTRFCYTTYDENLWRHQALAVRTLPPPSVSKSLVQCLKLQELKLFQRAKTLQLFTVWKKLASVKRFMTLSSFRASGEMF